MDSKYKMGLTTDYACAGSYVLVLRLATEFRYGRGHIFIEAKVFIALYRYAHILVQRQEGLWYKIMLFNLFVRHVSCWFQCFYVAHPPTKKHSKIATFYHITSFPVSRLNIIASNIYILRSFRLQHSKKAQMTIWFSLFSGGFSLSHKILGCVKKKRGGKERQNRKQNIQKRGNMFWTDNISSSFFWCKSTINRYQCTSYRICWGDVDRKKAHHK